MFQRVWSWVKSLWAWLDKPTDLGPVKATRGRIHGAEADRKPGNVLTVPASPKFVLKPARVWSDADQRWYTPDEWRARSQ